MSEWRNVFACMVHESQECVVDLVRNLRALDGTSPIILFNGGEDPSLTAGGFPFERYGVVVHPRPRLLAWGWLHEAAIDCMDFALERFPFDTLTIVDSDQLAVRAGYSAHLGSAFSDWEGIGMLGKVRGPQPPDTPEGPVKAAWREIELWRPFLRRFPHGEEKFPHWTFWPSTVFTAAAARDLVDFCSREEQLPEILRHTKIWATEELVLPTLTALLGYRVEINPCSYEYVRYKVDYSGRDLKQALVRPQVFWIHPIPRRYDSPLRSELRQRFDHYQPASPDPERDVGDEASDASPLLLTLPVLDRMRSIEGWLEDDEADLLTAAAVRAVQELPADHVVVEVGSYCGRSTVVLASVVQALRPAARVHAIDPHEGTVGALDRGLETGASTFERFQANLAAAGVDRVVESIRKHSFEVPWEQPISLLLIDGLHDYYNVARDFWHFERWVGPGGYIAFHDYADYYPGVKALVRELLAAGSYRTVRRVATLIVVRKLSAAEAELAPRLAAPPRSADPSKPLVSCIMPTCDRRIFVAQAIRYFLRQDYAPRELLIIDDGGEAVADLIPDDERIRYFRLAEKRSLGAKRNLGCAEARGEIIAHWDDDDWMAGWRLRYQVEQLVASGADLCGLDQLAFYDTRCARAWQYGCPRKDKTWLAGGTFCYRKELWRVNPFADVTVGEDTRFLWSGPPKKLLPLEDRSFYVAMLHGGNTSSSRRSGTVGWRPLPEDAAGSLLGEDREFYRGLAAAAERPHRPRRRPRSSELPLVSCIMPTRDRRQFAAQAIRYFLRQSYPAKELVIVDDGRRSLADLVPEDERVRYIRLTAEASIGRKRNIAVEHSQGEIIVHWDDDDWYAPDRLGDQVAPIVAGDADLAGFRSELYYDLPGQRFWRCTPQLHARMFYADVHGRSIAYRAEIWRNGGYPDVSQGEDVGFLRHALGRGGVITRLPGEKKLIYVRHRTNTWRFRCGELIDPDAWQAVPAPPFLPKAELSFYLQLA